MLYDGAIMENLLCFDLDDTLIPRGSSSIPEKEIEAINHRLQEGDGVALASGRPFASLKRHLSQFDEGEKYAICFNGAMVYSFDGELLYSSLLSLSDLYKVKRMFPDPRFDVYAYLPDGYIACFGKGKYVKVEERINRLPPSLVLPLDGNGVDMSIQVAKVMIGADPEVSKEIRFEGKGYSVTRSSPVFFEILSKGVDKSVGVSFLKEKTKAKRAICFGDELNDLRMIKENVGVAMGNAKSEVKQVASFVTKKVVEDGVAYAIKELLGQ